MDQNEASQSQYLTSYYESSGIGVRKTRPQKASNSALHKN